MSDSERGRSLKTLVSERLSAAAEEIFALVERTISEYEEELCRCRDENRRNQQLLESVLSPRVQLHKIGDVKLRCTSPSRSPSPPPPPCVSDQPKEETPAEMLDFTGVQVKSEQLEEPSPELHQILSTIRDRETDNNQEKMYNPNPLSEDFKLDNFQQNGDATNNSEDWGEGSSLAQHMGGADTGDMFEQLLLKESLSLRARVHRCHVCGKGFTGQSLLKRHSVVHTGERPFNCLVCHKAFSQKAHLKVHMCTHTGIMPYRCPLCPQGFTRKDLCLKHIGKHRERQPQGPCEKREGTVSERRVGPVRGKRVGPVSGKRAGPVSGKRAGPVSGKRVGPVSGRRGGRVSGRRGGRVSGRRGGPESERRLEQEQRVRTETDGEGPETSNRVRVFSCSFCQREFLCKNSLEKHMETHSHSKENRIDHHNWT